MLRNEKNALLTEARLLTENSIDDAISTIEDLKESFNGISILKPLKPGLDQLTSKILAQLSDGSLQSYISDLKQTVSGKDFFNNLFSTPNGKIIGQLTLVQGALHSLAKAANKILKVIASKENITIEDTKKIEQIIKKEVLGGWFTKMNRAFKVPAHPNLSPEGIVEAVLVPLIEYRFELTHSPENPVMVPLETFKAALKEIKEKFFGNVSKTLTDELVQSGKAEEKKSTSSKEKENLLKKGLEDKLTVSQISSLDKILTAAGLKVVKQ